MHEDDMTLTKEIPRLVGRNRGIKLDNLGGNTVTKDSIYNSAVTLSALWLFPGRRSMAFATRFQIACPAKSPSA
jgi:hypothetical protein